MCLRKMAIREANEIFLHFIKLIIYLLLGLYSQSALWLGLTIAVASIFSSYTVKYILPYLSEFVFKRIGYGAMVVSGIVLLTSTSQKIMEQDNVHLATMKVGDKNETTIKWRESDFVLEYALDDGLEVEQPILYEELPPHLKKQYHRLIPQYDVILLEKVFKLGQENSYEFYSYKNKKLTKFDFMEKEK